MNNKRVGFLLLGVLIVSSVTALIYYWVNSMPDLREGVVLWKGLYKSNFEWSLFRPCEGAEWTSNEPWWWAEGNLETVYTVNDDVTSFTIMYVEVMGEVSPKGNYGNLGVSERQIIIQEVIKVEKEIPSECR